MKTAEDTSGRSEAACEAAIEAIGREIANIHLEGKEQTRGEATPEHLVTATKAVTEAVAGGLRSLKIAKTKNKMNRCGGGLKGTPRSDCCCSKLWEEGR